MSEGLKRVFRLLLLGRSEPEDLSPERLSELRSRLTSEPEIRRLIVERGKIPAIRAFRKETGAPLKEAMAAVDDIEREFLEASGPSSPER